MTASYVTHKNDSVTLEELKSLYEKIYSFMQTVPQDEAEAFALTLARAFAIQKEGTHENNEPVGYGAGEIVPLSLPLLEKAIDDLSIQCGPFWKFGWAYSF